jgi:hypothetical protein
VMPPHITRLEPAPGEPLTGDVITVHGYSLRYAEDPKVTDETTGSPAEAALDLDVDIERRTDDPDPLPGSVQERSVMKIKLAKIETGHAYRLDYCEETWTFVAR